MELELIDEIENNNSLEKLMGFSGRIYFGVPDDTTLRDKQKKKVKSPIKKGKKEVVYEPAKINNALLLLYMEHGIPTNGTPPRPLLRPVIMKHKAEIEKVFMRVYNALVHNNTSVVDYEMDRLAQMIEMWGKKYFREDNGWEPNAPSTIRRKKSERPLIDTGQLRSAIRAIYVKK